MMHDVKSRCHWSTLPGLLKQKKLASVCDHQLFQSNVEYVGRYAVCSHEICRRYNFHGIIHAHVDKAYGIVFFERL